MGISSMWHEGFGDSDIDWCSYVWKTVASFVFSNFKNLNNFRKCRHLETAEWISKWFDTDQGREWFIQMNTMKIPGSGFIVMQGMHQNINDQKHLYMSYPNLQNNCHQYVEKINACFLLRECFVI